MAETQISFRRWLAALGMTVFLAAIVSGVPFLQESYREGWHRAFSLLCHQIESRSFTAGGVSMPVCQRCYGIYIGLVGGVILFPLMSARAGAFLRRCAAVVLAAALLPIGIDWALDAGGILNNTAGSRFFTGAVFGLVAGNYFTRAFEKVPDPTHPPGRRAFRHQTESIK